MRCFPDLATHRPTYWISLTHLAGLISSKSLNQGKDRELDPSLTLHKSTCMRLGDLDKRGVVKRIGVWGHQGVWNGE